jgi:hypothetical protein
LVRSLFLKFQDSRGAAGFWTPIIKCDIFEIRVDLFVRLAYYIATKVDSGLIWINKHKEKYMPRFPSKEAEIVSLAQLMWRGIKDNLTVFPNPPVGMPMFGARKDNFIAARNDALFAAAAAESANKAKDEALETLINAMKTDLRYAENAIGFDDAKLKLIGWSAKKSPAALTPPGQTRQLEIPAQGAASLTLSWNAPLSSDGGKPAAYTVQRRERAGGADGAWTAVATAVTREAMLVNQPVKIELEYRVIAINKAGEGLPSNTVMAVL